MYDVIRYSMKYWSLQRLIEISNKMKQKQWIAWCIFFYSVQCLKYRTRLWHFIDYIFSRSFLFRSHPYNGCMKLCDSQFVFVYLSRWKELMFFFHHFSDRHVEFNAVGRFYWRLYSTWIRFDVCINVATIIVELYQWAVSTRKTDILNR